MPNKNTTQIQQPSPFNNMIKKNFLSLTGSIAMVGLAIGSILPLSSLTLHRWTNNNTLIGFVIALYAVGLVLAYSLSEVFIRKIGAKKTVIVCSLSSSVCCLFLQYAYNVTLLSIGLLLLGICLGVVFNTVETWVNDIIPNIQRGRWIAIHCTFFTLFQLIGPLLIQILPIGLEFIICSVLLCSALPLYCLLSQHKLGVDNLVVNDNVWSYLINNPVLILSTGLFALFDTVILSLLPLYGIEQGLTQSLALTSASIVLIGDTTMEWLIGELADRFSRALIHSWCAIVLLLTSIGLPFSIGTLWWWPNLFILGATAGGVYVLSMVECGLRFSGKSLLRMTSLLGAVWGVSSIIGPLITGLVMEFNSKWAISFVLVIITLMLIVALLYERQLFQKKINK